MRKTQEMINKMLESKKLTHTKEHENSEVSHGNLRKHENYPQEVMKTSSKT